MGGNLAKSPLIAVIYAALLHFIAVFLPFSEGYTQSLGAHETTLFGYLMLIGYCLFSCIAAAIAFSALDKGGVGALLPLLPSFLGLGFVVPMLQPFLEGETTGVMTSRDILMRLAQGAAGLILMLVLSMLLCGKKEPPPAKEKHKIGVLNLVIFLLVLPILYTVIYFLVSYFLGWTNEVVRNFYGGHPDNGLLNMLVNMLLERPSAAGYALLRGLLLALFSLPLMLQLAGKKVMYIVLNAMLCASGALLYLMPSPLMPDEVRIPHLLVNGIVLLVYGALSAFLLHGTFQKSEPAPAPAAKGAPANAAPAAKPGGKPAPAKR